ncbi:MAG: hypothetical protein M0R22_09180 [Dehalococcoidia bacterium]|jgi:protein-S-isoprenylcysteine O-methyltransferase Ste14|nr:hypothetical protein [Dehalococcoidia bacterium]
MNRVWVTALVLIVGALVFRRAGQDYARYGKLTKATSTLQVLVFVLHGASSLLLLDSRFSTIDTGSPVFGLAALLIIGGLVLLATTLKSVGVNKAVGQESSELTCSGMYRRSRNPQVLFYGIAVIGYTLLWPSWSGIVWVVLYAILAQVMVKTEETHLKRAYGAGYVEYCEHTPRYIDLPGMK